METAHTLIELTEIGFARNTSGIALATKREGQWQRLSVATLREHVAHAALGLHDLGIRHGDRVALHAENSTEWVLVDLALLHLGAINVPIYTTQPSAQLRYIVEHAEARVYIVSSEELYTAFKSHEGQISSLKHTVGIHGAFAENMLTLDDVMQRGKAQNNTDPDLLNKLKADVKPTDLASFIYTSGTTGQPKGVMLTHQNIASNILAIEGLTFYEAVQDPSDKILSYLPLSHIFERMVTYANLYLGYPIYFAASIETIMQDLQDVEPIHFTTVPRLLEKIYASLQARVQAATGMERRILAWAFQLADTYEVAKPPRGFRALQHRWADRLVFSKFRSIFGRNLKGITSGGAALPAKIMNFMNAIGVPTAEGYGMTESSPVITTYNPKRLRAGSVGQAIPGVEVKIAEDGEILARGPNVMQGYYNLPEVTAETLVDGWLHTGDIGTFDKDGYLYITDRKKELLKLSTGKYIAPAPIEQRLITSAYIEQAVVIGTDYKFCSALIVPNIAAVCQQLGLDTEATPDGAAVHQCLAEAIEKANEGLPHWEQIKQFQVISKPFTIEGGELTPTLKLKRRVIQDKYKAEIEALYA